MRASRKSRRLLLAPVARHHRSILQRHVHLLPIIYLLLLLAFAVLSLLLLTTPSSLQQQQHSTRLINQQPSLPPPPTQADCSRATSLGEYGEMVLSLLPQDLAFTVFLPSPQAFRRVLRQGQGDANDTYAVVSRVLGFTAVPQHLPSAAVPLRKHVALADSISGLRLYGWRDLDGALVVNGVRSECVDLRFKSNIIVHLMSAIIMDPEFSTSFSSDP